jgi:putative geranylgeranyl diphosphate synthase
MKKAVLFLLIIAVTVVNGAKIKPLRSRRSSSNKPLIRPKEAPVRTRNSGDTEDTENVENIENIESAKTINNMKINNKFLNERLKEIKAPKVKEVEKKRDNSKTYVGEYMKSTNMFVYKKDNLVFKDKRLVYQLQDESGTLELIYNSIGNSHGVTEDDLVTLVVSGKVVNGVLVVDRILNYRIPEGRLSREVLEIED